MCMYLEILQAFPWFSDQSLYCNSLFLDVSWLRALRKSTLWCQRKGKFIFTNAFTSNRNSLGTYFISLLKRSSNFAHSEKNYQSAWILSQKWFKNLDNCHIVSELDSSMRLESGSKSVLEPFPLKLTIIIICRLLMANIWVQRYFV
jgi:hypothetical protein